MPELSKTILVNNTNIKSYLDFNGTDGSTTFTDTSGKTWSAVVTAQLDTAQQKFGTASLLLDGNSDYLTTPHTADLCTPGTGDFSIAFWVRFTTVTSVDHGFCGIRVDGSNTFRFRWDGLSGTTNRIKFIWADAGTVRASYEIAWTPSADTWYHVAITRSGTIFSCYVNGASLTLTNVITAISTNSLNDINSTFNIGVDLSGTVAYLNGWMDDFVFLKGTALSADQIKELYEGRYIGEGWAQSGLVAGYHLSDTTDFSGNNYHLTNNGTTTFAAGKFVNAADLGASNSSKYLNNTTNAIAAEADRTLTCWAKLTTAPGSNVRQAMFSHSYATEKRGYRVGYRNLSGTYYVYGGGYKDFVADYDIQKAITLTTTDWHCYVMTLSGTTATFYFDGASIGTITIPSGNGSGANTITNGLAIGRQSNSGDYAWFSGLVDEAHEYNVVKDAAWVRKQYAWGMGRLL